MYNAPDDVAAAPILPTEETVSFTLRFVIQSQFQRIRITAKQTNLQIASGIFAIIMGVMGAFSAAFKYSEAVMNACKARRRAAKRKTLGVGGKARRQSEMARKITRGHGVAGMEGRVTVTMPGGVPVDGASGTFEGSNPLTRKVRQQSIVAEWTPRGGLPSVSQGPSQPEDHRVTAPMRECEPPEATGISPKEVEEPEEGEHHALASGHTMSVLQWTPNPVRRPGEAHSRA
jgi:hypothetical protein